MKKQLSLIFKHVLRYFTCIEYILNMFTNIKHCIKIFFNLDDLSDSTLVSTVLADGQPSPQPLHLLEMVLF